MNLENILSIFHKKAVEHSIPYLIIGGFAASYWGKPRFTADIDYVIPKRCLDDALALFSEIKYKTEFIHPRKSFAHFVSENNKSFKIDLMLVDDGTWEKLNKDSSLAQFDSTDNLYPVVTAMHLIAMKLHAAKQEDREEYYKDLLDIAGIMKAQDIDLEMLEKEGILPKHGSKKTIKILKDIIGSE